MKILEKAISVATFYHADQTDKIGEPYILHPLRVMLFLEFENERVVAMLHDILEDTKYHESELKKEFPPEISNAVIAITKKDGEKYEEYLKRVCENELAKIVKIADIRDNLSPLRLYRMSIEKRLYFVEKYTKALN